MRDGLVLRVFGISTEEAYSARNNRQGYQHMAKSMGAKGNIIIVIILFLGDRGVGIKNTCYWVV